MDEITLKLNSPITDEQWDAITDVDFDNTDRIWFSTKHGKEVEFTKIVRCKDCKYADEYNQCDRMYVWNSADDFRCSNHPKGEQPHWTEEQIKRQNHCKNFQLADDVITVREYTPRKPKPKEADGFEQLTLDLDSGANERK